MKKIVMILAVTAFMSCEKRGIETAVPSSERTTTITEVAPKPLPPIIELDTAMVEPVKRGKCGTKPPKSTTVIKRGKCGTKPPRVQHDCATDTVPHVVQR